MEAFVCIAFLAVAVGLRLWAGFAWAELLDNMPEAERRQLLRKLSHAGY